MLECYGGITYRPGPRMSANKLPLLTGGGDAIHACRGLPDGLTQAAEHILEGERV